MRLFDRSRNMSSYKHELSDNVAETVRDLSEKELENSDDSLVLILISKFKIPLLELKEYYQTDGGEVKKDISKDHRFVAYGDPYPVYKKARVILIHIPFEGNPEFLNLSPSRFKMVTPRGEVIGNEIIMSFEFFPDVDNGENLKREIEREIKLVKENVVWMNEDITTFNNSLEGLISSNLSKRREDLKKGKAIIDNLGIPKKEEKILETGFVKPIQKIEVKIEIPSRNQDPFLENSIYEEITKHVNSLGINLERCKSLVRSLDEESLRDMFFMALNSAYKGLVSTEAFNHLGKTDVLIRKDDKNLYISEFKIWRNHDYFSDGIDQLLDNLTWRDSKCSYVIFSRNMDFSNVIEKAKELISKHPNHIKLTNKISENCFRFQFKNKTDSNKEVTLTLHLFNLA